MQAHGRHSRAAREGRLELHVVDGGHRGALDQLALGWRQFAGHDAVGGDDVGVEVDLQTCVGGHRRRQPSLEVSAGGIDRDAEDVFRCVERRRCGVGFDLHAVTRARFRCREVLDE